MLRGGLRLLQARPSRGDCAPDDQAVWQPQVLHPWQPQQLSADSRKGGGCRAQRRDCRAAAAAAPTQLPAALCCARKPCQLAQQQGLACALQAQHQHRGRCPLADAPACVAHRVWLLTERGCRRCPSRFLQVELRASGAGSGGRRCKCYGPRAAPAAADCQTAHEQHILRRRRDCRKPSISLNSHDGQNVCCCARCQRQPRCCADRLQHRIWAAFSRSRRRLERLSRLSSGSRQSSAAHRRLQLHPMGPSAAPRRRLKCR